MIEVIPSINHSDPAEIRRRIKLVESYVQWVHVDVSDGIFGSAKIFNDPGALHGFKTPARIELHLMIDKPEEHLTDWLKTPAERFLVHAESARDFPAIAEKLRIEHRKIGCALHPDTSPDAYARYSHLTTYVLVVGVIPGLSGQQMRPGTIEKISTLRRAYPDATIEADGGVSLALGTAKRAVQAGASALCSGYDIFSSKDIARTVERFRSL